MASLDKIKLWPKFQVVCNLYSVTTNREALRQLARAMGEWRDKELGNMEQLPAVFPNRFAPLGDPSQAGEKQSGCDGGFQRRIPGSKPRNPYLTNVRKTESRYWLPYLKNLDHRCLVPITSFAEPDRNGPRCIWTWFARDESRPLMFFAGIWREWEGDRGTKTKFVPQFPPALAFRRIPRPPPSQRAPDRKGWTHPACS